MMVACEILRCPKFNWKVHMLTEGKGGRDKGSYPLVAAVVVLGDQQKDFHISECMLKLDLNSSALVPCLHINFADESQPIQEQPVLLRTALLS